MMHSSYCTKFKLCYYVSNYKPHLFMVPNIGNKIQNYCRIFSIPDSKMRFCRIFWSINEIILDSVFLVIIVNSNFLKSHPSSAVEWRSFGELLLNLQIDIALYYSIDQVKCELTIMNFTIFPIHRWDELGTVIIVDHNVQLKVVTPDFCVWMFEGT